VAQTGKEKMMKILALDIDGVLTTSESVWNSHLQSHEFNADCVKRLKQIIAETQCQILVTSSWRFRGERWIKGFFKKSGIDVLDLTNDLGRQGRGAEIREWVARNPSVTAVVAVDDDWFVGVPLVQTSWSEGLTDSVMSDLIRLLNQQNNILRKTMDLSERHKVRNHCRRIRLSFSNCK